MTIILLKSTCDIFKIFILAVMRCNLLLEKPSYTLSKHVVISRKNLPCTYVHQGGCLANLWAMFSIPKNKSNRRGSDCIQLSSTCRISYCMSTCHIIGLTWDFFMSTCNIYHITIITFTLCLLVHIIIYLACQQYVAC